jgi:cell division protease FtsH
VGVGGDLRQATTLAMQMEAFSGMGTTIASHAVTKAVIAQQLGQSVETGTDRMWLETPFGERVEARLQELLDRVTKLLRKDRIWVLALAHALETNKTLPGEDVEAIMNGTVGPSIDGRIYHDPRVQRALEEYHAVAMAAHRDVGETKMRLPRFKLNGHAGATDAASEITDIVIEGVDEPAGALPVAATRKPRNGNGARKAATKGNGTARKPTPAKRTAARATGGAGARRRRATG